MDSLIIITTIEIIETKRKNIYIWKKKDNKSTAESFSEFFIIFQNDLG